jgi:hypothetical protein
MHTTIQGIPVMVDPSVSWKQINTIVAEIIQEWAWEGRNLEKIELLSDGQLLHICSYEKPSVKLIPLEG